MDPLVSVVLDEHGIPEAEVSTRELDERATEVLPLTGFLHVDNPSGRELGQLKQVWDYFAEEAQGHADLLHRIQQLENRMGSVRLGESRLGKIYNWVRLKQDIKSKEDKLASL